MQIKLYKVMCTTPAGAHWFVGSSAVDYGDGSDCLRYTLYSPEAADYSDSYSLRGSAEVAAQLLRAHPPKNVYAYRPGEGLYVDYVGMSPKVVEFVAEVKD